VSAAQNHESVVQRPALVQISIGDPLHRREEMPGHAARAGADFGAQSHAGM